MEQKQIVISAIVPCYKTEQFLERCVNSILTQTFQNFEIILVDDGSPDNTGMLADELASKDDRVTVVHEQNGGVTKARETGFNAAHGEWITFIDSDDTITPNSFYDLYQAAVDKNTDIVIGFPLGWPFPQIPDDYSIEDYRKDIISGQRVPVTVWGKLFRKSVITGFMFDIPREIICGEDLIFNIRCAYGTEIRPAVVNAHVYNYYTNEEGITHTYFCTPEFEDSFHKLRMRSIPVNDQIKYMKSIIDDRFHPIQWWSYKHVTDTSWLNCVFVKTLKADIEKYNYKLTAKQKMFFSNNKLLRLLLVYYRVKDHFVRSKNDCIIH